MTKTGLAQMMHDVQHASTFNVKGSLSGLSIFSVTHSQSFLERLGVDRPHYRLHLFRAQTFIQK